MLLEIAVAAVIGISFANAWTCLFMGFGTSTQHKVMGRWFIVGRLLGLGVLGSVISLLRFAAQDAMPALLLIFGISTLMFGAFMMIKHVAGTMFSTEHPMKFPNPREYVISALLSFFFVVPGGRKTGNGAKGFNGQCGGKHGQGTGGKNLGQCKKHRVPEKKYGLILGVLRGATPCAKIIVLSPLLVAVGFPQALLLILVYAAASTVYPVIGYLSADMLSKFEKYQVHLKITGAVVLIIIGAYSIVNVILWNANHSWV
jgi:hypothetical protein